jgi:hypothetical protein
MTDHRDHLKCPLCEGQGKVRRSQLLEFFSDPELKIKIDAYVARLAPQDEAPELVCATPHEPRNFQKDVHSWNPQVPMWTRSPKE